MHGHAISPVKCEPHDHEWVVDTGAPVHLTSKLELLLEVQRFQKMDYCLYTADGQPKHVQFIGSVRTNSFNFPGVHCLTGGGTMNVVSLCQLDRDHGLVTEFNPTSCCIKEKKTGKIVGEGRLRNGMYVLDYLRIVDQVKGEDMEEEASQILPPTTVDGPSPESQDLMVVEIESEHDNKTKLDGDVWVLDCSARMHYTSDVQLLDDSDDALPSFRDDDAHILARGHVRTKRFEVPNVSCVGGDARNVISVAQLARSHGLVSVFEPTVGYVRDTSTGKDVGRAYVRECDGVYVLEYLLIGEPQDIVDASVWPCPNTDEMQSGVSELTLELPDRMSWFGMSRSDLDSPKDPTVANAFPMSPYEEQGGTRTKQFYMDSGVCHHMTWNGDVLKAYDGTLNIKPPVESVMATRDIRSATRVNSDELSHPLKVGGIGYVDSTGGSLDGVLFVPGSDVNLVSVNQVTRDYSARVVFHRDEFWIEKLESKDRIGHGKWAGNSYLVAILDVGAASDWILNSSASIHHTSNRKMLYDFRETAEDVQLEGVNHMKILGHGSVRTERFKVPGIRYTAEDARNVISVVQLANDHGLVTIFEPGYCYVQEKGTGQIVGQGHLRNGVYVLKTLRINQEKGGKDGSGLSDQQLGQEEEEPPQMAKVEEHMEQEMPGKPGGDSFSYEIHQQPEQAGKVHTNTIISTPLVGQTMDSEEWILDTRASCHHTSIQQLLLCGRDLQDTAMQMPPSVDGPSLNLTHGLVRTKRVEVPDVSYVEGEARNVISVAQLTNSHGLVTIFEPTGCCMKDKKTGEIVGRGHIRDDGVYVLDNLHISQNKEGEQDVDGGSIGQGRFGDRRDEGRRNKSGSGTSGGRDKGRCRTKGEGGDQDVTSNGRGREHESRGGTGGGEDKGRGSHAGGEGGGRDGSGDDGNNGDGAGRGKEKKEGKDEEEWNNDNDDDDEEDEEEERGGGGENKEKEEDEGIKHDEHQELSHRGLLGNALEQSLCQCRKNAVRMILSGPCHCEQYGRESPGSAYKDHHVASAFYTPRGGAPSSQPSLKFYMDSGASYHMTCNGDLGFLKPYSDNIKLPVSFVYGIGGSECEVTRCGYINTEEITLEGVLHVPTGNYNLVSLSKLVTDYSARVVFDRKLFSIQRLDNQGELIGQGHRDNQHYVLDYFLPPCGLYVDTLPTTSFAAGGGSVSWPYNQLARR